ncbi:MAG: UxaA family hydrolase [Gammaproteobacteria bacterium]|nr:UxaA family hydrolase [Gammaproteobacteria bacterium]
MGDGPQGRETAGAVLVLNAEDNVVVCRRDVRAGERLVVDGDVLVARSDVTLGHKIARRPIHPGEHVVKYGMSIGSSTSEIQAGDWVHLHNMKSNYIQSHTRDSGPRR